MGFLCPVESPDGKNAGIQKSIALFCQISFSIEYMVPSFCKLIESFISQNQFGCHFFGSFNAKSLRYTKIVINGQVKYCTNKPFDFIQEFRKLRLDNKVDKFITYELQP